MPFSVSWGHLGEDSTCSKVGTVSFDAERLCQVQGDKHWGSRNIPLEFVKGGDKGRFGSYTKLCDFTLLFMILQVELKT